MAKKKAAKKVATRKVKEMTAEELIEFAQKYGFKAALYDKPRIISVVVTGRWFKKSEPKAIKVKRFPAAKR